VSLNAAPPVSLVTRGQFAELCNARGIVRAIEVGTDRGLFAEQFLRAWRGEILVCIDHWLPYPDMPYDRTADLVMAATLLAPFRSRVKLIRGESPRVAQPIGGYYRPGFVYIDADHREAAVAADLAAWWPKVAPGGILAGHDYMDEHAGVIRAVDTFSQCAGRPVHVTADLEEYRSWWIEKPA
jgi:Methyltransferase domain